MSIGCDQGSDIEIPILRVADGWMVDDIQSLDDCDDAIAYLTEAICRMENRSAQWVEDGANTGIAFRNLRRAMRWKRLALHNVQFKRGEILRAGRSVRHAAQIERGEATRARKRAEQLTDDRMIINLMKEMFPTEFAAIVQRMKASAQTSSEERSDTVDPLANTVA